MLASNRLRLLLGLLITAASLYLALRRVDFASVERTLSAAHLGPILLGLLAVFAGMLLKVIRWKVLLAAGLPASGNVPLAPVANSFIAAQLLNAIYPLRMGEIGRVALVGRVIHDYAYVAGTIAVEKALDLAFFLGLILFYPFMSRLYPAPAASTGSFSLPSGLSGREAILTLAVILIAGLGLVALARRLPAVTGLCGRLLGVANRLLAGMTTLRRPRFLIAVLLLTLLIWLFALLPNYYSLLALDIDLPPSAPLLVLLFVQVGISTPSLPAKVGIFEYACQLALSFYALRAETGLSYGILLHGIVYLPMIICGLPAIWLASTTRVPPASDSADGIRMEEA